MGETEMGDVPNSARTALARDRLIPSRSSSSRGQAGSAGTTVDNNWSQLAHMPPLAPLSDRLSPPLDSRSARHGWGAGAAGTA